MGKASFSPAIFFIVIASVFYGCNGAFSDLNKIGQYTWNPSLAFPIAKATFGFEDFINRNDTLALIEKDEEGLIILTYENNDLFSQNAASYLELPDETHTESFNFNSPLLIQLPIAFQISKTEFFNFKIETEEGDEIDSVLLQSGELELKMLANFPASGEVKFRFLSLFLNGEQVEFTYPWQYSGTQPVLDQTDILDLSNLKMDLTDGGTTVNTFNFEVEITLNYEGQPVLPSNSLEIEVKLLNATFKAIYGKISERKIDPVSDTLKLDFFDNLSNGFFYLDEPAISINIGNSFGLPVSVNILSFEASNETSTLNLTGDITQPQLINFPALGQLGDTIRTVITIDHTNSNLPELISMLPTQIIYVFEGTINPQGIADNSFVLNESIVDVDLKIELPLKGRLSDLEASNLFEFDVGEIAEDIDFVLFQIYTNNGFPLSLDIQLIFLDEIGTELERLIDEDNRILEAAEVNAEGNVTLSKEKTIQVIADDDKLQRIQSASTIRIEVVINTTGDGTTSVKILDSYQLEIKIGAQIDFGLNVGGS